jgi:molecular chaperone GrpE (heat shock protein)
MHDMLPPKVPKWPFYLSDAILLAAAWFIAWQGTLPLGRWEILGGVVCVLLGACVAVLPFVLEYKGIARLTEAASLSQAIEQMKHAEVIATRIREATDNWQAIQEQAGKTAASARGVAEQMAAEVKDFTEFLKKANDSEKATLRLEVEKLRRAEADWVQVLVRVLDHVYALHAAGVRSGQGRLADQLTQFQNACRDAARRVGLVPFAAPAGEDFDPQRHQTREGQPTPPGARVVETLAAGYSFQGKLVRPALVSVQSPAGSAAAESPSAASAGEAPQSSGSPQEPALL